MTALGVLLFYFYLIFETSYIFTWPSEKAPENNSSFVLSHRYLPVSFSVFYCSEYPVAWLMYHQSSFSWHYLLQKILSLRSCFHSSWEIKHLDWISVLHELDPQVAVEQKVHIKHCLHQPHLLRIHVLFFWVEQWHVLLPNIWRLKSIRWTFMCKVGSCLGA